MVKKDAGKRSGLRRSAKKALVVKKKQECLKRLAQFRRECLGSIVVECASTRCANYDSFESRAVL